MTELEKMKRAKMYLDKLAAGIDPISDVEMTEDTVLNNLRLARCFMYVSDILQRVIENDGYVVKNCRGHRTPFTITEEQLGRIEISDEPVGVAVFSKRVAAVLQDGVKPLSAVQISSWLCDNEYLQESIVHGKREKTVTPKGEVLGMLTIDGVSANGYAYRKNIYTKQAQEFLISHLNDISDSLNEA